ncbi:MAG: class I SAM-dependent methyltransferase [Candidatus Kapaibacterium sp.]
MINYKKDDWFHGWIYENIMELFLQPHYEAIARMIPKGARVLDIACGTGGLGFNIINKAEYYAGIDISEKNIRRAKLRKEGDIGNMEFFRGDALKLGEFVPGEFDYAVISLALHEMPPSIRRPVIESAMQKARFIILADYASPLPRNIMGRFMRVVEFFAGRGHYRGFRHFIASGGLRSLIAEEGLETISRERIFSNNIHIYLNKKFSE